MEQNLQNGSQEERVSKFTKWKWWRPLYYVYFLAISGAVVLLYSAHGGKTARMSNSPAVAVSQAQAVTPSTQPTGEQGKRPAASGTQASAGAVTSGSSAKGEMVATNTMPASSSSVSSGFADLVSPSPKNVAKGKSLFMDDCVACHGANGEGDGPAAAALKPKPRNFHSPVGWINGRTASGMFKTLTDGIPGSPMPPFSTISVNDRLAIISYIRSFKGFPKETAADIQKLAKMAGNSGGSAQGDD